MNGNKTLAYFKFKDPGMPYEADSAAGGEVVLNLPFAMFQSVVDILRNEKNKVFAVYFEQGRGFFKIS
jgi:hypothetical protein